MIVVMYFYSVPRYQVAINSVCGGPVRYMEKPRIYPSSLMTYLESEPCPQGPLVELFRVVGHRIVESAPEFR